jgi:hypothetical protein
MCFEEKLKEKMKDINDESILEMLDEKTIMSAAQLAKALELSDMPVMQLNDLLAGIVLNKGIQQMDMLIHYSIYLEAKSVLDNEMKVLEGAKSKIDDKLELIRHYINTY